MTGNTGMSTRPMAFPKPAQHFLANAIKVFDCFDADDGTGLIVADVARLSGINPSSVLRYLTTGVALGLLKRDAEGRRYFLESKPPTRERFEYTAGAPNVTEPIVNALWVLSCFSDPDVKRSADVVARTTLSLLVIRSKLGALVSVGYLVVVEARHFNATQYRLTDDPAKLDKRWVALVLAVDTPVLLAA